jgi:hypothetical protein
MVAVFCNYMGPVSGRAAGKWLGWSWEEGLWHWLKVKVVGQLSSAGLHFSLGCVDWRNEQEIQTQGSSIVSLTNISSCLVYRGHHNLCLYAQEELWTCDGANGLLK